LSIKAKKRPSSYKNPKVTSSKGNRGIKVSELKIYKKAARASVRKYKKVIRELKKY
jgi:hypothetical protein